MNKRLVASILGVVMLAGCSKAADNDTTADGTAVDADAELQAIHQAEQAQMAAFDADDLDGAVAPYAENAVFVADSAPVQGAAAIRQNFEGMLSDPNFAISFEPGTERVSSSGDLAYTSAHYTLTMTDPDTGDAATTDGSSLMVWTKQPDGSWKILADHNVSTPQTGATAAAPTEDSEAAVGEATANGSENGSASSGAMTKPMAQ